MKSFQEFMFESMSGDADYISEEFDTEEAAKAHMEKLKAKSSATHSVVKGRQSGKWHVLRHTAGGMHVVG